jgi:hypothetical protein
MDFIGIPLTGLEPVLSALRGRRVNQLHYSGIVERASSIGNLILLIDEGVVYTDGRPHATTEISPDILLRKVEIEQIRFALSRTEVVDIRLSFRAGLNPVSICMTSPSWLEQYLR